MIKWLVSHELKIFQIKLSRRFLNPKGSFLNSRSRKKGGGGGECEENELKTGRGRCSVRKKNQFSKNLNFCLFFFFLNIQSEQVLAGRKEVGKEGGQRGGNKKRRQNPSRCIYSPGINLRLINFFFFF